MAPVFRKTMRVSGCTRFRCWQNVIASSGSESNSTRANSKRSRQASSSAAAIDITQRSTKFCSYIVMKPRRFMFVANTRMKDFPTVASTFWAIEHSNWGQQCSALPSSRFQSKPIFKLNLIHPPEGVLLSVPQDETLGGLNSGAAVLSQTGMTTVVHQDD